MPGAERTCVACREKAAPEELVRLVAAPGGRLVVDLRAKLPGRGAWVHPRTACVERLDREPRRIRRALGEDVSAGGLAVELRDVVTRAALDGLSLAAAAGALVGGHDLLVRALGEGRVEDVVVADDASERTLADLRAAAAPDVPFTRVPLDRGALGDRVGKGPRAALGVTRSRAATHLRRQLRRLRELG